MRVASSLISILFLSACIGDGIATAPDNPAISRAAASGAGICPDPDPDRDGPLVDAIRRDDAGPVEAILTRSPGDARAQAALAIISGRGTVDPDQAACFAPYF